MRASLESISRFVALAACVALSWSTLSAQSNAGVHPRSKPSDYAATQQTRTATYAASVLSADQVRHLFAVDISKSYVVFEVALYPSPSEPPGTGAVKVDPGDFLVRVGSNSEFVHPADAVTIASVMQEKNTPRPRSNGSTDVYTSTEVGYESGTDPYTGRRVHGVYTGAGVGHGSDSGPPYPPPPGSTPYDRMTLESQLTAKALPTGSFTTPVAGFIYFPAKGMKKKSNGAYELDYLSDQTGDVHLQVTTKNR